MALGRSTSQREWLTYSRFHLMHPNCTVPRRWQPSTTWWTTALARWRYFHVCLSLSVCVFIRPVEVFSHLSVSVCVFFSGLFMAVSGRGDIALAIFEHFLKGEFYLVRQVVQDCTLSGGSHIQRTIAGRQSRLRRCMLTLRWWWGRQLFLPESPCLGLYKVGLRMHQPFFLPLPVGSIRETK